MTEKSAIALRTRVVGTLVLFAAMLLLPLGIAASAQAYLSSAPACGGGPGDDQPV